MARTHREGPTPPSGRKMVVTGASSFIGAHLARSLAMSGNQVVATTTRPVDAYGAPQIQRLRYAESGGAELHQLDITDEAELRAFIQEHTPDVWFHHAGFTTNYRSVDFDLVRAHRVNVEPLTTLYPALSETGCRGIIVTGSASEYGELSGALSEDGTCLPSTPYGLSKLTETLRARQLAEQHGLRTRVARVFLPFGPLDSPSKLIPAVVDALQHGLPLDMTSCEQLRDLVYIDDLVSGFRALVGDLDRDVSFDLFNLAGGQPLELKAFLLQLAVLLGVASSSLNFGARQRRPGEPDEQYGDGAKAHALLGWEPRPWQEGLAGYVSRITVEAGILA